MLSEATETLITRFATLITNTRTDLEKRDDITVQKLAHVALDLPATVGGGEPLLTDHEKELYKAKSKDEVMTILRKNISFFNFELLKYIIENLDLPVERLKEYEDEFATFCNRRVFEVPHGVFTKTSPKKKDKRYYFVVITDTFNMSSKVKKIKKVERKIAKILKLNSSTLQLYQIDEGSIILVYSIPMFVAKHLFPLNLVMLSGLKAEGLTIFYPKLAMVRNIIIPFICRHINNLRCMREGYGTHSVTLPVVFVHILSKVGHGKKYHYIPFIY